MYYIYMVRCSDNSIYTGITTSIERRLDEHISKGKLGAKYTHTHDVIGVECLYSTDSKSNASKLEYRIKKLTKNKKEELINDENVFSLLFSDYLEIDKYHRLNCDNLIECIYNGE